MKISICLYTFCQFLILSSVNCQDSHNAIAAALTQYHNYYPREKLYVHTDKSFFLAGENLFFKIYAVDASSHIPLELSKVAYVEILSAANTPVLQAKIELSKAEGSGSFELPRGLGSGNYKLRAYTNWMKNFDAGYFFERNLTIVNVQRNVNIAAEKSALTFDVEFFPEGGNLVNGLLSRVAFKATDQYGRGLNVKGFLLDDTDTLLTFKSAHAGMGTFLFTPANHHTYKAVLRSSSGEKQVKNLPQAYNSGYVMTLRDAGDEISISVQADSSYQGNIYLLAHTREVVKVEANSILQAGKSIFTFDKKLLGDGISHITVFNNQKQPVCERLYFKKPANPFEIALSASQPVYATRRKVNINIKPGNTGAENDSFSLSLSVYRLDSLQAQDTYNINSFLLLTSDLRGFVEDPDYYFLDGDGKAGADLDNLMLTNGWRRFKWEDVLKNTKPFFTYVPEYNGQIIFGNVLNTGTGKPAVGIESFIATTGVPAAFTTAISDTRGGLKFEFKNYYGARQIVVQPNHFGDSLYRIEVLDPFSKNFSARPVAPFKFMQNTANTLLKQSISLQVQKMYSGDKLKQLLIPNIDSIPFYLKPDAKYLLDDYTRFTTLEEVLREYVALTDVKKREGRFHFNLFDLANRQMLKNDPLVLLDGIPVNDLNSFMSIDPLKLKKVEVLNRKYFLGASMFNGVLNWTSYKGDMADYILGKYATVVDYEGLQMQREFYTPSYLYDDQRASHLPDFRNVLLWSPTIKIAGGETKEIDFYTSDLPGKYAAEVQGISKHGSCGSKVLNFEVKN